MRSTRRLFQGLILLALLAFIGASLAPAAQATYPGKAGPIAYSFVFAGEAETTGGLVTHGPRERQKARRLTEDPGDRAPAYSPNGRLIAFEGERDAGVTEGSQIYVARADGSGIRQLTSGAFYDGNPTFSPDGKTIVFDRSGVSDRRRHLFEVAVGGGEATQLTSGPASEFEAVFTPSGRSILFVSNRNKSARDDIFAMRPNGSHIRVLIGGPRNEDGPDVSPNGRRIVFSSNRDGRGPNLYLARVNGRGIHAITHSRHSCFESQCAVDPAFSPDGSHIAFVGIGRESSDLQVMRTDGRGFAKEFDEAGTEEEGFGTHIGAPAWGRAVG